MEPFEKEVIDRLARMEERLNSVCRKLDDMRTTNKEHDGRIDALEKWKVKVSALAAVAGAAASIAANWLLKKLGVH